MHSGRFHEVLPLVVAQILLRLASNSDYLHAISVLLEFWLDLLVGESSGEEH